MILRACLTFLLVTAYVTFGADLSAVPDKPLANKKELLFSDDFEGASMIDVEFDDRKYTGSHYGHLCRAQVRLTGVTIVDEREGSQNNAINELKKDPAKKAEVAKLLAGRSANYPFAAKLETGKWYTLVVETVGDEMRVTIDGKPAAFLKSSGIAHATKSKIELGVAGKDGFFDDIKVWNAEAAKQ